MIWPLFQEPEYEPKERLEITDPRMCHRCGILHKRYKRYRHCGYCRRELKGMSIMGQEPRQQVEPEPGLAMGVNEGLRYVFRTLSHPPLMWTLDQWSPIWSPPGMHHWEYRRGRNVGD